MFRFQRHVIRFFLLAFLVIAHASCGRSPQLAAPAPAPTSTSFQVTPVDVSPTTIAPTATAAPQPSPAPPELMEEAPQADGISRQLDAYLAGLETDDAFGGAVLVALGDDILLNRGYGQADRVGAISNTPQTRFRLGSLTKQFTAMAVAILQEQELLNVQDPICLYLDDCPNAWQGITIHQLLNHTSAIPDLTRFRDFEETKGIPSSLDETIARFRNRPLEFPPGEHWSYSNSGYILLGAIIERASGQPYDLFLAENVFTPLGMQDSGYDHNRDDLARGYLDGSHVEADFIDMSIPHAAGALYSTAEDMYRWDQALYTDQLVTESLLDALFTPYAVIPEDGGFGYGYGWAIGERFGRRVFNHSGGIEGFSAHIARYPDDKVTVIVLSNQQRTNPNAIATDLAEIVFAAR